MQLYLDQRVSAVVESNPTFTICPKEGYIDFGNPPYCIEMSKLMLHALKPKWPCLVTFRTLGL